MGRTCIELESSWDGPLFNNPPNVRLIAAIQSWVYYYWLPSLIPETFIAFAKSLTFPPLIESKL